jgi:hypothetical protein
MAEQNTSTAKKHRPDTALGCVPSSTSGIEENSGGAEEILGAFCDTAAASSVSAADETSTAINELHCFVDPNSGGSLV